MRSRTGVWSWLCLVVGAQWLVAIAASAEESKVGVSEMYPLAIGTEWVYKSGMLEVTERVTKHELLKGEWCARVETLYDSKVKSFEHIAVRKDGVYRVAISGNLVEPPLCFLKLPPRAEEKWSVESKIVGQSVTGDFSVSVSTATVPVGTFKTAAVAGKNFRAGPSELSFLYHYAPKYGKVKQVITTGSKSDGEERVMELKEFRLGK